MKQNDIMNKLEKQKSILESMGYKVAFIALYGSQNYGLDIYTDEYKSDVDMKAVVVPDLDDLIYNSKPVSEVIDTEWGQCDIKDIRTYFEILLKANPAYIETLFTEYFIVDEDFVDEFSEILSLREEIVYSLRAQFVRAMYGMMCEKEKALCHPYPSIADKIEKYGYDGKQAHHVLRLYLMMLDYFYEFKTMERSMKPDKEHYDSLMDLKTNKEDLDTVKGYVSYVMNLAKDVKENILSEINESTIDFSVKHRFTILSHRIIRNKIISEISKS
jgi:predicted nucleotidyltransferase